MKKTDTKQRIVQAAIRLFNAQGTAAVSTNHIAEAAGISPGNLYYHYRNKEEIIRAIFERMNTAWAQINTPPRNGVASPTELRGILGDTFSLLDEYRFFYREFVALMRRDPQLGQRYRQVRETGLANTEALLHAFVEGGFLRQPNDPATLPRLAKVIWLITEFWLPFAEMGDEAVGTERLREGVDLLMQILNPLMEDAAIAAFTNRQGDIAPQEITS